MSHSAEVLALSEKFGLSRAAFDRLVDGNGIGHTGDLLGTWQKILEQIEKEEVRAAVRVEMARKVGAGCSDALVTKYANDAVEGYRAREAERAAAPAPSLAPANSVAPPATPPLAPTPEQLRTAHALADKTHVPQFVIDGLIKSGGLESAMAFLNRKVEELKKTAPINGVASPKPPTPRKERKRNSPGFVKPPRQGKYISAGYFRMTNDFAETLLPVMPAPLLKAYVYVHRLARTDGTFRISHGTLANRIGAKTARHGRRVMERLQAAGLVRLLTRGSALTHTANAYQLVPLADLNVEKIRTALTA